MSRAAQVLHNLSESGKAPASVEADDKSGRFTLAYSNMDDQINVQVVDNEEETAYGIDLDNRAAIDASAVDALIKHAAAQSGVSLTKKDFGKGYATVWDNGIMGYNQTLGYSPKLTIDSKNFKKFVTTY